MMLKIKAGLALFLVMAVFCQAAEARSAERNRERERSHRPKDRILYVIGNYKKPPKNEQERDDMRQWMREQCRIHQGPFVKLQVDWAAMRFWCIIGE